MFKTAGGRKRKMQRMVSHDIIMFMGQASEARSDRERERVCYLKNLRSHPKSVRSNLNVPCLQCSLYTKMPRMRLRSITVVGWNVCIDYGRPVLTCTDVTAGHGFAITAPFAGTSLCFSKCLTMRTVLACALDATLEMPPENSHHSPIDLSPLLPMSTTSLLSLRAFWHCSLLLIFLLSITHVRHFWSPRSLWHGALLCALPNRAFRGVRMWLFSQIQAQLIQHKSQRPEYHVVGMVPYPVSN